MGSPGSAAPSSRCLNTALLAIFLRRLVGSWFVTDASTPTCVERDPGIAHASAATPKAHWSTPRSLRAVSWAATVKSACDSDDPATRVSPARKPYEMPGVVGFQCDT